MLGTNGCVGDSTMRFPTVWNGFCRALVLDSVSRHSRIFAGFLTGDFDHRDTRYIEVLNGWFWTVRRQALEHVGGLDGRFFMYGEDMDWSYRFHDAGWRNEFCAETVAVHYEGARIAPARFYAESSAQIFQFWQIHQRLLVTFAYLSIYAPQPLHPSLPEGYDGSPPHPPVRGIFLGWFFSFHPGDVAIKKPASTFLRRVHTRGPHSKRSNL